MNKALYAGSFDPFTNGHLFIYNQAKEIFDEVTILIATNPKKKKYFSESKMVDAIQSIPNVDCVACDSGLVADYCKEHGIKYLVRGLRNTSDYLYEEEIAKVNQEIYAELRTIYFRADNDVISSSLIRILYERDRDFSKYIPNEILEITH